MTAFQTWEGPIPAYFNHRATNACTESANTLIRADQRMGRRDSFNVPRTRILFARHGAHRMKPFRKPGLMRRPTRAEAELGDGVPSTDIEPEEISQGVETSTLPELIENGEV